MNKTLHLVWRGGAWHGKARQGGAGQGMVFQLKHGGVLKNEN